MVTRYAHLKLNQDNVALAGYYTPLKEVRLAYKNREFLYVVSNAVVDSSCCGISDFVSALVPGYIVAWQSEKNKDGIPVSQVEPITDNAARDKIRETIRENEQVSQVEFW